MILNFVAAYWLPFVIYSIVCGASAAFIAKLRNRDQGNWFVYGLAGGAISLAVLFMLKKFPEPPNNNLLLDAGNHLRSGWRVLLYFVTVIVVYYLLAVIADLTRVVPPQSLLFLFYISVALATLLMVRAVDKKKFISVGFPYHGKILKEMALGFFIGTVMIVIVGGAELLFGAIKLSLRPNVGMILLLRNFGLSFVFFGFFAMGEELLFRGYPFQAFTSGMGPVGATAVMSLVFGALHLGNPEAGIFSTVNTMLAGAFLCAAYLKTRTLYFPFGIHFAWNFVQNFFLSLPVSGLLTNRTIFIPTDYGPDWFTGGRYGPEAGVGTTIIMIMAILYFIFDNKIKPAYDFVGMNSGIAAEKSVPTLS